MSSSSDGPTCDASQVVLHAPAKVNLSLRVGAADPAHNGMHPISSWMMAVNLCDTVVLEHDPNAKGASPTAFDRQFADDAPLPTDIDWPIESDLGWRALQMLERHVRSPLPVRVRIEKRIPAGMGLAGGSGNAAAVMHGVNRLLGLGLSVDTLARLAARLGSDVIFCVHAMAGSSHALVTAMGDRVAVFPGPSVSLVLVVSRLTCPTGSVYKCFDTLVAEGTIEPATFDVRSDTALPSQPPTDGQIVNDLAVPATRTTPKLATLYQHIVDVTGRPVHVTGSGAGLFLLAQDTDDARSLATRINESTPPSDAAALPVHTVS